MWRRYHPFRMALIRKLFWIVVFLVSTLGFVVLFEHGTTNFADNFVKQAEALQSFVQEHLKAPGQKTKAG